MEFLFGGMYPPTLASIKILETEALKIPRPCCDTLALRAVGSKEMCTCCVVFSLSTLDGAINPLLFVPTSLLLRPTPLLLPRPPMAPPMLLPPPPPLPPPLMYNMLPLPLALPQSPPSLLRELPPSLPPLKEVLRGSLYAAPSDSSLNCDGRFLNDSRYASP